MIQDFVLVQISFAKWWKICIDRDLRRNSLTLITNHKIPWLFPGSEKDWNFPDFSLTVATLSRPIVAMIQLMFMGCATSISIVYSMVCSGTDQRKHQSSMSLNSQHKGPVTWKMFPFYVVIMWICILRSQSLNSSSPGQNVCCFSDISSAISWMKSLVFWFKFHWILFL